ncbi:hypothetical protein RCL1_005097 [Eukaryota sp. TZLM3-RCL]
MFKGLNFDTSDTSDFSLDLSAGDSNESSSTFSFSLRAMEVDEPTTPSKDAGFQLKAFSQFIDLAADSQSTPAPIAKKTPVPPKETPAKQTPPTHIPSSTDESTPKSTGSLPSSKFAARIPQMKTPLVNLPPTPTPPRKIKRTLDFTPPDVTPIPTKSVSTPDGPCTPLSLPVPVPRPSLPIASTPSLTPAPSSTPKFDLKSTLNKLQVLKPIQPTPTVEKDSIKATQPSTPMPTEQVTVEPDHEYLALIESIKAVANDKSGEDSSVFEKMMFYETKVLEMQDYLMKQKEVLEQISVDAQLLYNEVLFLLNPILDSKIDGIMKELVDAETFVRINSQDYSKTELKDISEILV